MMEKLLNFTEQNFWAMFMLALFCVALMIAISIVYRVTKGKKLPTIPASELIFSEKGASGRSLRSFLTKPGGARNCLVVQLSSRYLLVRPFFPFNLMFLPKIYDLEHYIPREKIKNITPGKSFVRKTVLVEFEGERGRKKKIELSLRKYDEFLKAVAA